MDDPEKLLVDVCCGPCSLPLEEININHPTQKFEIVFYVTNSNVHPFNEYVRRLQSIRQVSKHYKHGIIVDSYNPREWAEYVKGYEDEPEGQKRCELCFTYRLERAANFAATNGFKRFTTTLTTGPSKDAELINRLGRSAAARHNIEFVELDLKKKGGFLKSIMLSKKLGLYRQNNCGCVYSTRKTRSANHAKTAEKDLLMH
jgi:epoxyqueuosine reductase